MCVLLRYEELMLAEVQHSHEVNALQKKFESWAETDQRVPATRPLTSKPPGAKDVTSNLPPEVAQYTVSLCRCKAWKFLLFLQAMTEKFLFLSTW